ncbi:MAG: ECF transporter S component [Prevotella sp.]|nr:ECF transporter S component [Prevotella sp.]
MNSNNVSHNRTRVYGLVAVGLMAALVYAGNYMSIPLANETRIHIGNSMCLLAGLLFGGVNGGLSSGIGGALYDLFNPLYTLSAPYTFFSKFAMGWTAGKLNRSGIKSEFAKAVTAAVAGQLVYIVLYLGKAFVTQLILGNPFQTAAAVMLEKAAASLVNGAIAVAVSVPLYLALKKALHASGFGRMIESRPESKGYFNPLTTALTVFAVIVTAGFAVRLSADGKIKEAQAEKEAAYVRQIGELNEKLDYLYETMGVEPPVNAEEDA